MRSIITRFLLLCAFGVSAPGGADAAIITSTFDNYRYTYTVVPVTGEQIRSFHIYSGLIECGTYSYWDMGVPAGWYCHPETFDGRCVITFYTNGDPLPVGEEVVFAYTHYCLPCCHSWFVGDEGGPSPVGHVIDDDEQHTELCNIPAPWDSQCGGPGLLLAPRFPDAVDAPGQPWGALKATYR